MPKKSPLIPLIIGAVLTLSGIVLTFSLSRSLPVISPLGSAPETQPPPPTPAPKNRVVMAFLPYWLVDEVKNRDLPGFTHLAYFGLEFDGQGNLKQSLPDGSKELGLTYYLGEPFSQISRKVKDQGGKVILVLRMMDNADIESALNSTSVADKIVNEAVAAVKQRSLDGINIDFEYNGTPPLATTDNLTGFASNLKKACVQINPSCQISIDVYAEAARKSRIWDIKSLASIVDHVVIMGYDFNRPASEYAGPVAPLRGACQPNSIVAAIKDISDGAISPCALDYDITTSVRDHLTLVPKEKVILAVPFYGYDWPTDSNLPKSKTTDRGITATHKRIVPLAASLKLIKSEYQMAFDPLSLTAYLIYNDQGQTRQIWFDDAQSLKLKRKLVDNADLAGIAVWAWGYEDETGLLWDAVKN